MNEEPTKKPEINLTSMTAYRNYPPEIKRVRAAVKAVSNQEPVLNTANFFKVFPITLPRKETRGRRGRRNRKNRKTRKGKGNRA